MRRVLLPLDVAPPRPPAGKIVRLSGPTMGVEWRVGFVASAESRAPDLRSRIQARLDGLVMQMSPWEAGSDISRFNAAPSGAWVDLPPDFAAVVRRALHWAALSDGAFDPSLGRLVDLWGFGAERHASATPLPGDLDGARARAGWRNLNLLAGADRLRQPGGIGLDLSGIVKGYAVDAIAELLRREGILDFLVEIGGECRGEGCKPDGAPWWVGLEAPPGAADPMPIVCGLHGLALATSGGHVNDFVRGGRAYSHTIDGRTGEPALSDIAGASVVADTAMDADALATVLMVLDSDAGLAFAEAQGVAARLFVKVQGALEERLTPAFAAMLD